MVETTRNLTDVLELILCMSDETQLRFETVESWSGLIDQIYDIDDLRSCVYAPLTLAIFVLFA